MQHHANSAQQHADQFLASVLRADRARILSRIVSIVGDLQQAEDALQEACEAASRTWPNSQLPTNPQGWLVVTARRRAIDRLRSLSAANRREMMLRERAMTWGSENSDYSVGDDRLRLIFTCCHPALAPEIQVALTLQVVCGLSISEIAAAFLVSESAMSQRITRGKRKIRDTHIAYRVPETAELPARVRGVLAVIYLVFNAGYLTATGQRPVRVDLLDEAVRLADLLVELLDREPEVLGLAALLHLTDARRMSRTDQFGVPVDLTAQDRSSWDHVQINDGLELLARARQFEQPGPYQLQAAIAAVHARATSADSTDWTSIASLYDGLIVLVPSPTVAMNRAVAIGLARGAGEGLRLLDDPSVATALERHHRYHAARGHLLESAGDEAAARAAWQRAYELADSDHARSSLRTRMTRLESS